MLLSEYLAKSCKEHNRSPHDLLRCIATFIPNSHPLAASALRDLESMAFSPPESIAMFYGRFMDDLCADFPELDFEESPLWVKAISILVMGGQAKQSDLLRWFDSDAACVMESPDKEAV